MPILQLFCFDALPFSWGGVLRSTFRPSNASTFPTYPLSFHSVAHSFALCKSTTLFFSIVSALFAKNHPGWGYGPLMGTSTIARTRALGFTYLWIAPMRR